LEKAIWRILINGRLAGRGGIETHLWHLSRLLVDAGAQVTVVSRYATADSALVEAGRVISTPFARDLRWFRLSTAAAVLTWPFRLDGPFDVVLTTEVSPFLALLRRRLRAGGHVLWNRIGDLARAEDRPGPFAARQLDGVIAESEPQAEAVRALQLGVRVAALPLIGHIASPPPRRSRPASAPLRVSFLGRFVSDKGIFRLLDLWPKLQIGEARLVFHGGGSEHAALADQISRRRLANVDLGRPWSDANELAAILEDTDLVVLLSKTEGLPVVLMEALAHGVPFVATDVGAIATLAALDPVLRVVPEWREDLAIRAIEEAAAAIRAGRVDGARLQAAHARELGYAVLSQKWRDALLTPERVFGR
jgi:glycosyltransferase involved in cell wall biosynthesis